MLAKNSSKRITTTHNVIKFIILIAQCFALLPVDGVTSANVEDLKFKWFTKKSFFTALSFIATLFVVVMGFQHSIILGVKFNQIGK